MIKIMIEKKLPKRQNSVETQGDLDYSSWLGEQLLLLSELPGNTAIEQFVHSRKGGILKT